MSFIGVLDMIGKDFAKGLAWASQYALPVEKLTALLFPAVAPEMTSAAAATTLIQNAVLIVEQKYAAAGIAKGTGTQKLAEVMTLAGNAVTSLLSQAGIKADTGYIQNVVSAVVGILNVQAQPADAPPAS